MNADAPSLTLPRALLARGREASDSERVGARRRSGPRLAAVVTTEEPALRKPVRRLCYVGDLGIALGKKECGSAIP